MADTPVDNTTIINTISTDIHDMVTKLKNDTTAVKNDLADNYYDKETIESLFTAGIKTQFVTALPDTGIEGIIYFVPIDTPAETTLNNDVNVYREYVWCKVDGVYQWEALGSTELNISQYYVKNEVDTFVAEKMSIQTIPLKTSELQDDTGILKVRIVDSLPTTGDAKVMYLVPCAEADIKDADNKYNEYLWINGAFNKIGPHDAVLYAELENYYKKTETYSKEEIDTAIADMLTYITEETDEYAEFNSVIGYVDNINGEVIE